MGREAVEQTRLTTRVVRVGQRLEGLADRLATGLPGRVRVRTELLPAREPAQQDDVVKRVQRHERHEEADETKALLEPDESEPLDAEDPSSEDGDRQQAALPEVAAGDVAKLVGEDRAQFVVVALREQVVGQKDVSQAGNRTRDERVRDLGGLALKQEESAGSVAQLRTEPFDALAALPIERNAIPKDHDQIRRETEAGEDDRAEGGDEHRARRPDDRNDREETPTPIIAEPTATAITVSVPFATRHIDADVSRSERTVGYVPRAIETIGMVTIPNVTSMMVPNSRRAMPNSSTPAVPTAAVARSISPREYPARMATTGSPNPPTCWTRLSRCKRSSTGSSIASTRRAYARNPRNGPTARTRTNAAAASIVVDSISQIKIVLGFTHDLEP